MMSEIVRFGTPIVGVLCIILSFLFINPVKHAGMGALQYSTLQFMTEILNLIPPDSVFVKPAILAIVSVILAFTILPFACR